jgi:hypothetical protein
MVIDYPVNGTVHPIQRSNGAKEDTAIVNNSIQMLHSCDIMAYSAVTIRLQNQRKPFTHIINRKSQLGMSFVINK